MVDLETARQMALSFTWSEEKGHFGIPSFRVKNKIFVTLWVKENRMMLKLPQIHQSVFHSFDPAIFYPVPNKWGHKGATFVELSKVPPAMLQDALNIAYLAGAAGKK